MSYSAFPIKKSRQTREQNMIEAYRTIEVTRDNLKKYAETMALLTDLERRSISREVHRLSIWLADKYDDLKETKQVA